MIIRSEGLTKVFPNGKGIFDVSFEVKKGEVFGYLGPNGAGKTVTIRHLMGFLHPTDGSSEIDGLDCWRDTAQIQEKVGYIPGEIAFLEGMNGLGFLKLLTDMRGIKDMSRRDQLIERFQLDAKPQIRKMSKGTKQKLAIVAAFMHDPDILIMDEPSAGLDPLMQRLFNHFVLEEKSRGKTIFMSSHNFEEIEHTCDRAGIIKEGKLVAVENIHSMKSLQRRVFIVSVKTPKDIEIIKQSGLEVFGEDNLTVNVAVLVDYQHFVKVLSSCGITDLDIKSQRLEEVFIHYYEREAQLS